MSNVATYESYYATLNSYVKSDGMTYTMGNPGTSVPDGYIGILNSLVIDENSGYPSLSFITYPGYPASDFSFIAYGVSYNAAFVTSAASLVRLHVHRQPEWRKPVLHAQLPLRTDRGHPRGDRRHTDLELHHLVDDRDKHELDLYDQRPARLPQRRPRRASPAPRC